jgi:hypothetical protein
MVKTILSGYGAVALCFVHPYRKRPTVAGVITSLFWPVSLALALAWLAKADDDALVI